MIFAVVGVIMAIGIISKNNKELEPYLIVIAILLTIIVFCVFMIVKALRNDSRNKKKIAAEVQSRSASCFAALSHFTGLPLPENTMCQIYSTPYGIQIVANGQQFNLAKEKILDVCIKSEAEIQKQYVSSAGGAVGGALLFGPIGAMIGGRVKEKKTVQYRNFLIFTYQKEPAITDYIAFISTGSSRASHFVKEFQSQPHKTPMNINL